jgi:hypothetical protein
MKGINGCYKGLVCEIKNEAGKIVRGYTAFVLKNAYWMTGEQLVSEKRCQSE